MLNLEQTAFEFDNFSYELGPTGKIRYSAPSGFNDDIVMAHALAVWSLQPLYKEPPLKFKPRLRSFYESKKREFTNDLEDADVFF
jgi:hypothetical protein